MLRAYLVVDEAALLQSRLHFLFIRKHLENAERQRTGRIVRMGDRKFRGQNQRQEEEEMKRGRQKAGKGSGRRGDWMGRSGQFSLLHGDLPVLIHLQL